MRHLASLLLLASLTAACTTDASGDEQDFALAAGGKADTAGRSLRYRSKLAEGESQAVQTTQPLAWRTAKVDVVTASTIVVTGEPLSVLHGPEIDLLQLSVHQRPTDHSDIVMLVVSYETGDPLLCRNSEGSVGMFKELTINFMDRELYADGVTFTYAQCGITHDEFPDEIPGLLSTIVVPVANTEGKLLGAHEYALEAKAL